VRKTDVTSGKDLWKKYILIGNSNIKINNKKPPFNSHYTGEPALAGISS